MLIITCKQFDKHIILSCRKMALHHLKELRNLQSQQQIVMVLVLQEQPMCLWLLLKKNQF